MSFFSFCPFFIIISSNLLWKDLCCEQNTCNKRFLNDSRQYFSAYCLYGYNIEVPHGPLAREQPRQKDHECLQEQE